MARKVEFWKGMSLSTVHVKPESHEWLERYSTLSYTTRSGFDDESVTISHYMLVVLSQRLDRHIPQEILPIIEFAKANNCEVIEIGHYLPVVDEFPVFPQPFDTFTETGEVCRRTL